ncbi:MAG TPA: SDR family NAD(P)-dependent oxidoreductase, partial [Fibrobacteraceae bacterium]|nr:SDR family NAD(P)-dependent oxidoreductase [Fibrobacteraceae bacterium]
TRDTPFPMMEGVDWDQVIGTNLTGLYNVLKPIVMPMVEAKIGGRIVTLSSISGLIGNRGQVNYAASKAGIIGVTRSLAKELARRKICVNCIAPGMIDTEMMAGFEAEKAEFIKHIPMRRYGTPEEVAALAAFLVSPQCSYITGEVISINGGML